MSAVLAVSSVLVFASADIESSASAASVSYSSTPQGLLLYVGYDSRSGKYLYTEYTDDDLDTLTSYIDEFVILSGNTPYNYDISGTQIITEDKINNLSADLVNNAADLESIKADYKYLLTGDESDTSVASDLTIENPKESGFSPYVSLLFNHLDPNMYKDGEFSVESAMAESAISTKLTLSALAKSVENLVKNIVAANSNAVIWLPFPLIEFPSLAEEYVTPFTKYMNKLKSDLDTSIWKKNIRGFYWCTEAVVQYYTPFDYTAASDNFNNPMVKAMSSMGNKVSNLGKQMLWIPYYDNYNAETLQRLGYTVNRTTIFDYVMLQSGYYFYSDKAVNIYCIQKCIEEDAVYSPDKTTLYGGSKATGAATVSYEMEIDDRVSQQAYNDRYYGYTSEFSSYKTYPFMFYAGDRSSTMNSYVQLLLKAWFDSDAAQSFYTINEYNAILEE